MLKAAYFQNSSSGAMLEVLVLMVKPQGKTSPLTHKDSEFSYISAGPLGATRLLRVYAKPFASLASDLFLRIKFLSSLGLRS